MVPVVPQMRNVLGPGCLQIVQKVQRLQIKKETYWYKKRPSLCQDGQSGKVKESKVQLFQFLCDNLADMKLARLLAKEFSFYERVVI